MDICRVMGCFQMSRRCVGRDCGVERISCVGGQGGVNRGSGEEKVFGNWVDRLSEVL